jgi:hypothetical protein
MSDSVTDVKELIRGWLEYTKANKIRQPEDTHLAQYLVSKGYQQNVISQLIAAMPDASSQGSPTPDSNLSDEQQKTLKKFQKTLRTQFNKKQLGLLQKELSR